MPSVLAGMLTNRSASREAAVAHQKNAEFMALIPQSPVVRYVNQVRPSPGGVA